MMHTLKGGVWQLSILPLIDFNRFQTDFRLLANYFYYAHMEWSLDNICLFLTANKTTIFQTDILHLS